MKPPITLYCKFGSRGGEIPLRDLNFIPAMSGGGPFLPPKEAADRALAQAELFNDLQALRQAREDRIERSQIIREFFAECADLMIQEIDKLSGWVELVERITDAARNRRA